MLKRSSKPADRRSIVAGNHSKRIGDLEDPGCGISEDQQASHPRAEYRGVGRQRDATMTDTPQDKRSGECIDSASPAYSPNHYLKRTNFRPHSIPRTDSSKLVRFYTKFHELWRHQEVIGEGGDGIVHLYQRPEEHGHMSVAVKLPRCYSAREDIEKEIMNVRLIGQHEHILQLIYNSNDWYPYGPAMLTPYCELGSLIDYRQSWCQQQVWNDQSESVSEVTMWKLFRDMALALNFLHSELGVCYVHNDLKPGNILVEIPPDQFVYQILPEEPTFKLSDFARLAPWPTPKRKPERCFDGTPEFAPPQHEQRAPVQPSADIWGLGATLQYMALGIIPIQSKEAFIRCRKAKGRSYPEVNDQYAWTSERWRSRIPTVVRPIDIPLEALRKDFDLSRDVHGYQPYGARLGFWYAQLWNPVATRPKASKLVAEAVPHMNDMIERLKLERLKQIDQYQEYVASSEVQ